MSGKVAVGIVLKMFDRSARRSARHDCSSHIGMADRLEAGESPHHAVRRSRQHGCLLTDWFGWWSLRPSVAQCGG